MTLTRIGIIVAASIVALAGIYALFQALDERSAPPIIIEDARATLPIVVDVRGAVARAGVYELPPGARVQDAITAAGGLAEVADLSTVNLARRLHDGEVLTVLALPLEDDTPSPASHVGAASDNASPQRININTASIEELDVLPGIGEVTAARIIAYRDANGPFRAVDDLIHVDGISDRTIDAFRDTVTVGP